MVKPVVFRGPVAHFNAPASPPHRITVNLNWSGSSRDCSSNVRCVVGETAMRAEMSSARANRRNCSSAGDGSSVLGVTPGLVPILAGGIDDPAIGLEELIGDLEHREYQRAIRTPGGMAAAGL